MGCVDVEWLESKLFPLRLTWTSPAKTFWRGLGVSQVRDKAPLSGGSSCYKGTSQCQKTGGLAAPLIMLSLFYPIPGIRSNATTAESIPERPKRPAERLPVRRWCQYSTPRTELNVFSLMAEQFPVVHLDHPNPEG